MGREIKFRVWDTISGTMTPLHKFADWDIKNLIKDFSKPNKIENVRLMQSTGLKDKNGKEIYEGDIVLDPRRVQDHQHIEVFWSDNLSMFMLRNNRKTWSEELYPHVERYEVIGNIYEAPELLNSEQVQANTKPHSKLDHKLTKE